jgi:hypothetical protein
MRPSAMAGVDEIRANAPQSRKRALLLAAREPVRP